MADNVPITAGSGTNIATDDIGSTHYQWVKLAWGPDDTANKVDTATDKPLPVQSLVKTTTVSTQVTRPANTTTYAINDALADTTPTTGGFTFTSAARVSGGSGIITDMMVSFEEDAATPLQGELVIFDQAVTAIADNGVFAISDAEARTVVAIIPFTLQDFGNQGIAHVQNLSVGFTCSGSANLRFLVRVKNAYVPTTNSSIITFNLKIMQTN